MASLYEEGVTGEPDYEKAFSLYMKAAQMNDPRGLCNVGYCYEIGSGVQKDEFKAFEYYNKAARLGDEVAQCNVGYCYEVGIGIAVNKRKLSNFMNYLQKVVSHVHYVILLSSMKMDMAQNKIIKKLLNIIKKQHKLIIQERFMT